MSVFNFFNKSTKKESKDLQSVQPTQPASFTQSTQTAQPAPTDKPKTDPTDAKRVHNLIIVDESGSMGCIYYPALTGINETLQTIRGAQMEHENQDHTVTLITFSTGRYNELYANTPVEETGEILQTQYHPNGCTPLYDAMGRSISELRQKVEKGDVVLVTVITDGYENDSHEYNGAMIKALIEELKGEGWVFTYIGANQNVEEVAASMSIDNHLEFEEDAEGAKAMFEKERQSRLKFCNALNQDLSISDLSKDYFNR